MGCVAPIGSSRGTVGISENMRRHISRSKKPLREDESPAARVNADLAAIKQRKSLVRPFFKAESVSYTSY